MGFASRLAIRSADEDAGNLPLILVREHEEGGSPGSRPFPSTETGETIMVPFVAAALPALINAAPALIRLFGNGEQSEKNAKAAETVAAIAKEITSQPTVEGAVNAIESDPAQAQAFSQAVESRWYELTGESGGGGIAGARKADAAAQASGKPWMSPALWISLALLPLVYLVVAAVLFGEGWTNDIRAMVVSSIISLVLGSVTGFFLGTSYGSQRKTDMLAER